MCTRNLPEVVLIFGPITPGKALAFSKQVERAIARLQSQRNPAELILIIDSEGGNFSPALKTMIENIRTAPVPTAAVISKAFSAAAMIAMAASRREITETGSFGFHDGMIDVASIDIDPDGRLSPTLHDKLLKMSALNRELVHANKFKITDAMKSRWSASGILILNAKECLEAGIVSRIV